jgi:hypothetical protein
MTQLVKYVGPTSNIGDAAVPITISATVVANVVGFAPLGFFVIVLFVLVTIPTFDLTASWRLRQVLS